MSSRKVKSLTFRYSNVKKNRKTIRSMPTKNKTKSLFRTRSTNIFSSSLLNKHHKTMLKKILKKKIKTFLLTPRLYKNIIRLRRKILNKMQRYDNLNEKCNIITPKAVLIAIKEISYDLFADREIVDFLLDKFTTDDTNIQYPGAFVPPKQMLINCEFIRNGLPIITQILSSNKINKFEENQEYDNRISDLEKMLLLIEHEFVHFIISEANLWDKNEDGSILAHGINFTILNKNIFNQGWSDLAVAHVIPYKMTKSKSEFTHFLLSQKNQFNIEYIDEVYKILQSNLHLHAE